AAAGPGGDHGPARLKGRVLTAAEHVVEGSEMLRRRRIVTVGLVLAMAVVALESTVVVTALPTIVGEFDRLDLYPWVFSAYLLTSTVTMPLYSKLADVFGRRRIFLFGMALFLLGSVLCGLAQGMTQLIVFRALQGLGAGALMLMGGLTALLLAMTQGSEGGGWTSLPVLVLVIATVVMLVGFVVAERRAVDPVLPLSLFRLRVMSVSAVGNTLSGAVLF